LPIYKERTVRNQRVFSFQLSAITGCREKTDGFGLT
jgi:hypothetical protein